MKKPPDPNNKAVGARIISARMARGVSQAGLAKLISTQGVTVFRHEKGLVRPSLDSAMKYAAALGVTVEWILNGGADGPPPSEPKPVARTKDADASQVPMVVAQLLAGGRLGSVSVDEIAFLSRYARVEPGLTANDFEIELLSRRARNSRSDADVQGLNAALRRQASEHHERTFDLQHGSEPPPPASAPDTVRKATGKRKPRKH